MKHNFTLIFILLSLASFSQVDKLKNFTYLKASGDIPQEFLTLSSDKSKKDYNANKDKDLDKDFFLSTRFFIDELLLSGNILFNEELSKYVNKVAKYVLRKEKNLFKELQFYVLKSNSVNAFSTDQGIIFVTTGLLAQLENEAQLAFILAHEIAHYTEKHVREGYVETQNIRNGKGKYRRHSYDDKVSELSIYSKDNEHDADSEGIEIFLNSEYDIETVFTSFEILLYAYLPFEDIKFDTTFFNTEYLNIPGSMFPDTINQISKEEDYDDHLSTHPNVQKRMDKSFDLIGDRKTKGSLKFKISESTFKIVRNLARFESINQNLVNRQYVDAIYSIYLLQRKFPSNKFLDFSLVKALYGLAKYKNNSRYNEVILKLKNTEGEQYSPAYFFKKIQKEQLNIIAYRFAYDLLKKYPNDNIIKKYERSMLKELALNSNIKSKDLLAVDYKTYNDSLENLVFTFNIKDSISKIDENNDLSKYKKIKLKKALYALEGKSSEQLSADQFHLTALSDLVSNGNLINDIEYFIGQKELEDQKEIEENKKKKKDREKEKGLAIKKLVVVDPYYSDYNIHDKKNRVKSEKNKITMTEIYTQNYSRIDLESILVDSKSLNKNDVEKYNEIGLLYQWVSEILEHDQIKMISASNQNMQVIKEKYNTEHFMFSGVIKYKERKEFSSAHLYGLFFIYTAPIVIVDLLAIHHYFDYFSFVINTETDEVEYTKSEYTNLPATKYVLQAYIYNVLYNLNKQ